MDKQHSRVSLKIVSIYALTGSLWILLSDKAMWLFTSDQTTITTISLFKGWVYVLLTAMLLYWLIERYIAKIRLSENELKSSKETFLKAFTYAPVLMSISTIDDGKYIEVNNMFTQVTGFSRQEAIGRTSIEIGWISALSRELLISTLRRDERVSEVEIELTAKDGRSIYCLYSGEFVTIDGQQRLLSIAIDITERKSAEAELVKRESQYRTLVETLPDVIYSYSTTRGGIFYSRHVEDIFGYTATYMLDHPMFWSNSIHPEDKGSVTKALEDFKNGGDIDITYRVQHRDGSWHWLRDRCYDAGYDNNEKIVYGIATDITVRKNADEELQKAKNHLEAMINALPDLMFRIDREGYIHEFRSSAAELLYIQPDKFLGKKIIDVLPEEAARIIMGALGEAVEKGSHRGATYSMQMPQGILWYELSIAPMGKPDEAEANFIMLARDITQRKQAEQLALELNHELEHRVEQRTVELKALNNELTAFNYSISHDMRAPLIRIKWYADTLSDTCSSKLSEDELQYVSRLKAASHRLDEHIEALLKLYQIDRVDFYKEPVNLSELAVTILNDLQYLDQGRKVTFTVADGMILNADKMLTKAFLENLISNAWKYTAEKEEARIELGVTNQDGREVYFIRDNGAGFNIDQVDNIFTPFLRLHKEDTGLGIGLASMQRIIRLHGGKIWADSREGEGATFYFTLQ